MSSSFTALGNSIKRNSIYCFMYLYWALLGSFSLLVQLRRRKRSYENRIENWRLELKAISLALLKLRSWASLIIHKCFIFHKLLLLTACMQASINFGDLRPAITRNAAPACVGTFLSDIIVAEHEALLLEVVNASFLESREIETRQRALTFYLDHRWRRHNINFQDPNNVFLLFQGVSCFALS